MFVNVYSRFRLYVGLCGFVSVGCFVFQLRVAKVTGGAASKLAKIKFVRKSIARVLTVYNQTQKERLRANDWGKYKPTDLRSKKTRAIRRRLTAAQVRCNCNVLQSFVASMLWVFVWRLSVVVLGIEWTTL